MKPIILTLALCLTAFAQEALVVSVSGELSLDMANTIMDEVSYSITKKSDKYDIIINDDQFREALKKEWNQGNISDDKIKSLAKSMGAKYLCFAKVNKVKGLNGQQIIVKLIDLQSVPMREIGNGRETIKESEFIDLPHLTGIFSKAVGDMLGISTEPTPTPAPTPTPTPTPVPTPTPAKSNVLTDSRDGKTYRVVKIGEQIWMAENLNYAASESKCYDNNSTNCAKYGRLYDWKTALKACPSGWHLPSDAEWTTLENTVGGRSTAGKKLKAKSGNGTDEFGFSALPGGGFNSYYGYFNHVGSYGFWWSSTEKDAGDAWSREMYQSNAPVYRSNYGYNKGSLFSVRCLRD